MPLESAIRKALERLFHGRTAVIGPQEPNSYTWPFPAAAHLHLSLFRMEFRIMQLDVREIPACE
jgi:hypothetical protein